MILKTDPATETHIGSNKIKGVPLESIGNSNGLGDNKKSKQMPGQISCLRQSMKFPEQININSVLEKNIILTAGIVQAK